MNYLKQIPYVSSVLVMLFLCILKSNSQSLSINWGKEQELHKRGIISDVKLINMDKNVMFYMITSTKAFTEEQYIVKHNRLTGENKYFNISTPIKSSEIVYNEVKFDGNDLEIISSVEQINEGLSQKYKMLVDTATMQIKQDKTKLSDENSLPDNTSAAYIVDNLELFETTPMVVYTNDSAGNHYAVNRKFTSKKDSRKFINSIVSIVYYPKDKSKPVYLPLTLPNNCYISSYQLSINGDGDIVCAGLYAKENIQSASGCYSFVVSPGLTGIKSVDIKEFSTDLLVKGLNEEDSQKVLKSIGANKEFEDNTMYLSSQIHYNKDKSYTVVVEKYRLEVVIDMKSSNRTSYHFFGDLYVLNCDASGHIRWMQKIPRFANVTGNVSMAAKYFLKYDANDNMYFIFNLMESKKVFDQVSESRTVCVKLDINGAERFAELESNSNISKYICPTFFTVNDDVVIAVKMKYVTSMLENATLIETITFGELNLKDF